MVHSLHGQHNIKKTRGNKVQIFKRTKKQYLLYTKWDKEPDLKEGASKALSKKDSNGGFQATGKTTRKNKEKDKNRS